MEPKVIETAIAQMKARIRFHVQNEVDALEKTIGVTPSDIDVNMTEVTTYGDVGRRYVVGEVTIRIVR